MSGAGLDSTERNKKDAGAQTHASLTRKSPLEVGVVSDRLPLAIHYWSLQAKPFVIRLVRHAVNPPHRVVRLR